LGGVLIAYTTGVLINILLLILTIRVARVSWNVAFALCSFLWSAGGLVSVITPAGRLHLIAQALHFTGAAAIPLPILATWNSPWVLRFAACVTGSAVAVFLWSAAFTQRQVNAAEHSTVFNATILLALGAATSLNRFSTPRSVYRPSIVLVLAVTFATISMTFAHSAVGGSSLLANIASHLVLVVVLCAFLLFARFRYADLFIRHAMRILLAGFWTMALVAVTDAIVYWHGHGQVSANRNLNLLLLILFGNTLLLSFAGVSDSLARAVNRWMFHTPDYASELRRLRERLSTLHNEPEITAAAEEAARRPLELTAARVVPADDDTCAPIPVSTGGKVRYALEITPDQDRPGLVSTDLDYLRQVAAQCGARLDALDRERAARQVTEAELRALRAQVNPHFLFNSLNTIADLIVSDPRHAEDMTVRLADVFRHVLANSTRPVVSVREEFEFARAYLHIEEIRFRDRLQVEITMDPSIAAEQIPSLILQPLLENALKHGLGRKAGPVHLWISAAADHDRIALVVEDDGLGPGASANGPSATGHGLRNVRERLATLYHDRASLMVEARERGGCRATVSLPRGNA
jgi:two-component system, LytTR family, sensor kinase